MTPSRHKPRQRARLIEVDWKWKQTGVKVAAGLNGWSHFDYQQHNTDMLTQYFHADGGLYPCLMLLGLFILVCAHPQSVGETQLSDLAC